MYLILRRMLCLFERSYAEQCLSFFSMGPGQLHLNSEDFKQIGFAPGSFEAFAF